LMSMVCGLDLHRQQITFDALVLESGESWRGRLWRPDRERFRRWLRDDVTPRAQGGPVALAVEGCTGWRYVVEEIVAAGFEAHVAEPADTKNARGRKHRAKTDRTDARLIRELLQAGDLPESWIPPTEVLEWRERVRLYKSLIDQRTTWCQRIRVGYQMIDATDAEALPLRKELQRFGGRQPACRALADAHYGIGGLLAVAVWSELGDCRRFSRSRQAVRHTGLDVAVDASDRRRAGGYLSRQGPQTLRWALYEAAKNSSHQRSPDHAYYARVKERHGGKIAAIAVARQFTRRCYHILRNLDPDIVYAIPT
jgi:transposase